VAVGGSTLVNKCLHRDDVGKQIALRFRGWAANRSGVKYRDIEVGVDEPVARLAPATHAEGLPALPAEPPSDDASSTEDVETEPY